jgi:hypothetical protein
MKIRHVGAKLFRADTRTGMTKLIVAFCRFAKAPNKGVKQAKKRSGVTAEQANK